MKSKVAPIGNFNYDAKVQTGFFLHSHLGYLHLTSFFRLVFTSHITSNCRVSEMSKVIRRFLSGVRNAMDDADNVVFFSKRSIVINCQ